MIYLDNKTLLQELYIPRQEYISVTTGSGGTYAEGYADGVNDQKAKLASTAFTENGDYQRNDGWSAITVNVPQSGSVLEGKEIVVSQDVTIVVPTSGYDGFSAVTVDATEYGQTNYDSGFDDGYTDGYSSGSSEGYDSGYTEGYNSGYTSGETDGYNSGYTSGSTDGFNSGYTSGETDGFNSGYTSGETHQKSLLVSTAITENGEYTRENGYSAITVNVPTGTSYNIEENKQFTANTNGNYTITPSSGTTTVTDRFDSDTDRYYITARAIGYPLVGIYYLFYIEDEFDSSKGQIDVYIENGYLEYDDSNWYGGDIFDFSVSREIDLFIKNANRYFDWYPLEDFDYHYDAMSAVSLTVNVDTATTYSSGYTDGENHIISTFTAATATTNGVYGSSTNPLSSITVNVPTGSTATLGVGSFSANGTYSASTDNLDGYSAITINVPTSGDSVKYLEYIETNGTQIGWDTGYNIGTDIDAKIYLDFMPISGDGYGDFWFAYYGDCSENVLFRRADNSYSIGFMFGNNRTKMDSSGYYVVNGNRYLISLDKNGITDENTGTLLVTASSSSINSTKNLYLNCEGLSGNKQVYRCIRARYYSFRVENGNGETTLDMRPCLDGNNVPCFYDEVSQTYIYHIGSGTPIAGPIYDPSYQSGYTDGYTSGYTSGYTDGSASIAPLIGRSITEIVIPSGVTNIGRYAFASCSSLSSVTIPNSVTRIDGNAFQYCYSLPSITIPNSVTSIGSNAFVSCSSLSSVTISNSVTSIDSYVFQYCSSLSSITIPNSVTSIGGNAFASCSSLSSVTISNSVTSIDVNVFQNCSKLPSITIPNSVTSIGGNSFDACSKLIEVNIGSGVTIINQRAFRNCSALTNIYISATTAPTISNANAFQGVPSTGTVHYPQGSDYSSWQSNTYLSGWTFVGDL